MSLRGLPDWNKPLVAGGAFAAYEHPGIWFAVPARFEPAVRSGISIDRFAQDRMADGGITRYGVHTLRWEAVTDVDDHLAESGSGLTHVPPRPVPFDGGLVRLTGPAVLRDSRTGEPALGEAFALDQAGLATFVAVLSLDDASTELVIDAHRRGTALIGADAVLVARGVAARHPAVVEIDLATLTSALVGDGEAPAVVAVDRLGELIVTAPGTLGIRFTSGAPADDVATAHAVAAVLDRIVARLATPLAPPSREPDALALGARIPARIRITAPAAGTLRWDLSEPLVAPRLFGLASSGLLPGSDPPEIREHTPPTLSSGWHRLEVSTTAVPPWAGALLGFDLEVPPNPPARPQRIRVGELFGDSAQALVDFRLTPLETLSGTVTGTVVFDSGEQAAGEPTPLVQESVLLRTSSFPARFIPIELAGGLTGCDVTVEWSPTGAGPGATAHLGPDVGHLLLVVPPVGDAALRVQAVAVDGRAATTGQLPTVSLLVDEFLFPGTGSQTVPIEVDFGDGSPATVSVELVPEGADDNPSVVVVRSFARGHSRSEWTRFVGSPFATGYRWRVVGDADWSGVVRAPSGTPLRVSAAGNRNKKEQDMGETLAGDAETVVAGLRLLAVGDRDGREWVFVPETPAIATQPGGGQSMSLIEAGGHNLLTLTGRLTASEEQHVRAREELGERHGIPPEQVVLRPATLANPSASVTITVDGLSTELATSTTSGLWPYNAVFQAQLTQPQAEAVRRAWAGERGLLNLHYEAELRTGDAESSISSSTSSSSTVSTTVSTITRTGDGPVVTGSSSTEHSETGASTVASSAPTVRPLAIDLDGADWPMPQHHR